MGCFFFVIWDLRVTLVPDWQRQTQLVSLLPEENRPKDNTTSILGDRSFGQACTRARLPLPPFVLSPGTLSRVSATEKYEKKKTDLRAANNVAQLRS